MKIVIGGPDRPRGALYGAGPRQARRVRLYGATSRPACRRTWSARRRTCAPCCPRSRSARRTPASSTPPTRRGPGKVRTIEVPTATTCRRVPIGIVARSPRPGAGARIRRLRAGAEGQAILRTHGFAPEMRTPRRRPPRSTAAVVRLRASSSIVAAAAGRAAPGRVTGESSGSSASPVAVQRPRPHAAHHVVATMLTVVLGTPLAYLLARASFPRARRSDTLVDLPITIPPVVAGVALLLGLRPPRPDRPAPRRARRPDRVHQHGRGDGAGLHRQPVLREGGPGGVRGRRPPARGAARTLGAQPLAGVLDGDGAAGPAGAPLRRRPGLGAGALRVRRHDDVRGQLPGPHADPARSR